MATLTIESTLKTPEIKFNPVEGIIEITGRSNPENSKQFYQPLFDSLEAYAESPLQKTIMNIKLEHFNTSSSKCLMDVFKKLKMLKAEEKEIEINWFYEDDDEDIMEAGETYEAMTGMKFNLIGY
jgi:SiaC family regulatory phosphoprotein